MTDNAFQWSCDFCKTAIFETFGDTEEHEKNCLANPANIALKNSATEEPNQSWICDKCKVEEFSTFEEAVEHEKSCPGVQRYRCDICKLANFNTYEEALAHEVLCAKKNSVVKPPKKSSNKNETSKLKTVCIPVSNSKCKEKNVADIKLNKENYSDTIVKNALEEASLTRQSKQSKQQQHEKVSIFPQSVGSSQKSSLPILEPLVGNNSDTPYFYKISLYHSTIASTVDLIETKFISQTNVSSVLGFRCTYCKIEFDSVQTINAMSYNLPTLLHSHLTQTCSLVPLETKERLQNLYAQKDRGRMSFPIFCEKFCNENGIGEDNAPGGNSVLVPLLNREWKLTKMNRKSKEVSKKKGTTLESMTTTLLKEEKPKTFDNSKIIKKSSFPLRAPELETHFQRLNSFNSIAIDNIEFYVVPDLLKHCPDGFRKLGLRCKHCLNAFDRLPTVDTWYKTVYSIAYSHFTKSCNALPMEVRAKLNNKGTKNNQGKLGLKAYCTYVSKQYSLVELIPNGDTVLACVGVQYGGPALSARKRKSQELKHNTVLKANDSLRSSKRQSIAARSETQSRTNSKKCGLYKKNGLKINLGPIGGVPLLNSFTIEKQSKLSRRNKMLLDNLELCERCGESNAIKKIALRCQNCKSNSSQKFIMPLTKTENWHEQVIACISHLISCAVTTRNVRATMGSYRRLESVSVAMKDYCDFLTNLYGLTDVDRQSEEGVIWGPCKYGLEEYESKPNGIRLLEESEMTFTDLPLLVGTKTTTISKVPRHQLMLQVKSSFRSSSNEDTPDEMVAATNPTETTIVTTNRIRYFLTDYGYFFMRQLLFVPVDKPPSLPRARSQRAKSHLSLGSVISSSLPLSTPTSTSTPEKDKSEPILVGACCRHCGHKWSISAFDNFVNVRIYQCYGHFQSCPKIPHNVKKIITDLKITNKIQSESGTLTMQEYLRKLMKEVYNMRMFTLNGVDCGVALGDDYDNIIQKYNEKRDTSDTGGDSSTSLECNSSPLLNKRSVCLPFCLSDVVQPVTPSVAKICIS